MNSLYRWTTNIMEKYNAEVWERYDDHSQPPHWHDFYEIELYISGNGSTTVNGKDYRISPNTLCFLTPTDYHSFQPDPGEGFSYITFIFTSNYIENSVISEFISLCHCIFTQIDNEEAARFISLTRNLKNEFVSNKYLNKKYIQNLISCIIIELLRLMKEKTDSSSELENLPFPIQKAIYYIHTHFKEPVTLDDVSRFVGFSSNYMSKTFHESLGRGFKDYLTALRLNHAKQLLLLSDESITDIAYASGFNSLSHFLHVFQKEYHDSPLQFRKKKAQKQ